MTVRCVTPGVTDLEPDPDHPGCVNQQLRQAWLGTINPSDHPNQPDYTDHAYHPDHSNHHQPDNPDPKKVLKIVMSFSQFPLNRGFGALQSDAGYKNMFFLISIIPKFNVNINWLSNVLSTTTFFTQNIHSRSVVSNSNTVFFKSGRRGVLIANMLLRRGKIWNLAQKDLTS